MKIYTRQGDAGETGLFGGGRVSKDATRVEAYGVIDELNATLGWARAQLEQAQRPELDAILKSVETVQYELFDLGGEIATAPSARDAVKDRVPVVSQASVDRMEGEIDAADAELPALTTFVLPGGHPTAAALHLCRTSCRRAERRLVRLHQDAPLRPVALTYVNRLSDLLFNLARLANHRLGVEEPKWVPSER